MALEIKQSLKLSQQLVITPQLQQAIRLLQLSRMELQTLVQHELLENPILEETLRVMALVGVVTPYFLARGPFVGAIGAASLAARLPCPVEFRRLEEPAGHQAPLRVGDPVARRR